jgi:hypothetical protein
VVWNVQQRQARDTPFWQMEQCIREIFVLRQFGTILNKYLIKRKTVIINCESKRLGYTR